MNSVQHLFLRLFVPLILILTGGTWYYGQQEINHKLIQFRNNETLNVRLGAGALSSRIDSLSSDLKFLSLHRALHSAINQDTKENLSYLAEDFSIFSRSKRVYDQIRWIDENGMEKVRVDYLNGKPQVIPASKLQNKSQRYYFTDTFRLEQGEVFISPFDLNVEHKKIEVPYKPMIRLATPVTNQQGKKRGIVILNYYGADMLNSFVMAIINNADHSMIINREGYWLKSSNPLNEWGFMFKRPDLNMAVLFPAAWQQISSINNGQMSLNSGDWTWATVYPLLANKKNDTGTIETHGYSVRELEARHYYWKVISHLSTDKLDAIKLIFWLKLAGINCLLLSILGMGSWKLARAWSMLADAEQNYRTVADFTYDWETWIAPTGSYRYCSPSCARVTGRSADEFIDEPELLHTITYQDDQALLAEHLKKHTTTKELYELQFRIVLPDGQIRWIEHTCVPVFGVAGEYLGRRAVNRDITNRKLAAEKLSQLNVELEQRVVERTVDLEKAKEDAEEANRAKGIFIANMSHQFRTPLNAVLGFSQEMLEDHSLSGKYREYLNIIHRNGRLQLSLINDVLAMSSLEDGKSSINLEVLDLSRMLEDVINKGQQAASGKNIAFNIKYISQMPRLIHSDYEKLKQILNAVIENAVKYTQTGGINLYLGTQPLESNDHIELNFDIKDSGTGIPVEFQERIFLPFVQVGEQNDKTGTGLGLTLAQRFLELMGGNISLESELGRGTVFHISFPVKQVDDAGFETQELQLSNIIETKDLDLKLIAGELEVLDDKTSSELANAVFALDVEHVLAVARRIEEHTPGLAGSLVTMMNKLDFKILQRLLKSD